MRDEDKSFEQTILTTIIVVYTIVVVYMLITDGTVEEIVSVPEVSIEEALKGFEDGHQ